MGEPTYELEKVVDYDDDDNRRWYKCRWAGYGPSDDTRQLERNLGRCYQPIKAYCDRHRLTMAIERKGGAKVAGTQSRHNLNNWVSLPQVMAKLASSKSVPSYILDLEHSALDTAEDKAPKTRSGPSLTVLLHESHFYVVTRSTSGEARIADSLDMAADKAVRNQLAKFARKLRADHCGAERAGRGKFNRQLQMEGLRS